VVEHFLAHKTVLCAEEITVVGHRCTMNGRVPETDRVGVIERWPALTTQKEVRHVYWSSWGLQKVYIKILPESQLL
jgi:hypothetical protein